MGKEPKTTKKKSVIFLAWIIPIIAIIISYSMVKDHYEQKGNEITIYVKDIKGLNTRKSHIEYKGVKIGKLLSIAPDENNINRFEIKAMLYSDFNYMVKKGSLFWVVAPKISTEAIENVGTVLTGNYIETLPPTLDVKELRQAQPQFIFTALDDKPLKKGLALTKVSSFGDISKGSSIVYKNIKVGEVLDKELQEDKSIKYSLLVYEKYKNLIDKNTVFYQNKAVDLKVSKLDISLKVDSFKNLLGGSISFIDGKDLKVDNKYIYKNKDELYFDNKTINLRILSQTTAKNIFYKNKIVAKVVQNNFDQANNSSRLKVVFKTNYLKLLEDSPVFYTFKTGFDIENIKLSKLIEDDKIYIRTKQTPSTQKDNFRVSIIDKNKPNGKAFVIVSDKITNNQKVYFKNIEVGYVSKVYLKEQRKKAKIIIFKEYKYLVNDSTKFYAINDIDTDISLDGIKVSVSSIKQMIQGGVGFITPSKNTQSKKEFKLYNSIDDIKKEKEQNNSFEIALNLSNLHNITKNSKLFYKNLPIAKVKDILLKDEKITVVLQVKNKYKNLFGDSAKIYLEGTKVSLSGVKNLSSSVLGDKLHLLASKNDGFKNSFELDSINPHETKYKDGLRVTVTNDDAYGVSLNAPVYYKHFQIGQIENISLNTQTNKIELKLFIKKEYASYIKDTSVFTKTSVIDMDLGLFGSKVKIGTIQSLLKGGLDVTSPKEFNSLATNNSTYKLIKKEKNEN